MNVFDNIYYENIWQGLIEIYTNKSYSETVAALDGNLIWRWRVKERKEEKSVWKKIGQKELNGYNSQRYRSVGWATWAAEAVLLPSS